MQQASKIGWQDVLTCHLSCRLGRLMSVVGLPGSTWFLQDTAVELDRLIPPFKGASDMELGFLAGQTLLPIDVEGDRQYFISIPHGRIMRKDLLLKALKGELDERTL